ncbi:MAG: inorganic pyrophosphatase [Chloroflexi bacterium]|nr:inorganic pyrophosphatase [Chloroflexota bacterium]
MSKSLELARTFLGKLVHVTMDRPLGSLHPREGFLYEANYGYIEGTLAPDGSELDAYYLGVGRPLSQGTGVCIAVVHRLNDDDDKLVVVPLGTNLSDEQIVEATHFQERWFDTTIVRC